MRLLASALWIVTAGIVLAGAQTLICFGNEPSWSVNFNGPSRASVSVLGVSNRQFRGSETRNDPLRERVWRGRATGVRGDAVLFLREGACGDGMSDVMHPITARLSMPDGSFFTGCCRLPGGPTEMSTALEGASWRAVSLPGAGGTTLVPGGRGPTVQFEGGRVSGFGGCNRFTGSYTQEVDRLTLGNLAGTMMACPEPAMTLERAFMSAMTGTLSYSITGNRLRLTSASGSVLEFERSPAVTLEGKAWRVTGYNNGREAVASPITGTQLTLSFANGMVTGQAGCNTFRASFSTEGSNLKIGPAATTRRMCSRAAMNQERGFLAALESVTKWSVDGDQLRLQRVDDQTALTAAPMQTR